MDHFGQDQFNRFLMQSIVLLCLVWFYRSNSIQISRFFLNNSKKVENHELLMFQYCIDICLKVLKFHVFFRKNRKKVENQLHLIFQYCIEKCLKVYKFHVFFRKNRKKVENQEHLIF